MELVLRAVAVYFIVLLVFVIAGKRQLAEVDPFRLVLLLIISEAVQEALIDDNHSITGAAIIIVVLIGLEMLMSFLKARFPVVEKLTSAGPLILIDRGKVLMDRMKKENVTEEDILSAGRVLHGIERVDQIKYAILEDSGDISVIPLRPNRS
jgi:uncharacterized membrane protein YcaP (DUF421 family)